jgi:hypothetical protein
VIVENKFGKVDLDIKHYKDILVSFSGGADSTLMYWLLLAGIAPECDVTFHTLTGVTPQKGRFKQFTSQQNFDNLREDFPHHNILDRHIIYNKTQIEVGNYATAMQQNGTVDLRLFGLTRNPPHDIMKANDLMYKREPVRDEDGDPWRTDHAGAFFEPFRNIDKRWVAQCFIDFGLMDRYYNNTISCERLRETVDMSHNEDPCGHCWWCREKKMAFGILDGQYDCNITK